MQTGFSNAISNSFNITGGRLSFMDPPGTRHLSGSQRLLGMFAGNRIAQDNVFDKIHRGASQHANQRLGDTIQKGWQDGILTRSESNQIKDASRHRGISRQRVNVDNYRKSYGNALKNAHRDGKITPRERRQLRGMRGRLRGMNKQLGSMVQNDRRMDGREAIQNRFGGKQVVGFNPQKFMQNFASKLGHGCCGHPPMNHCGQGMMDRLQGGGFFGGPGGPGGAGGPGGVPGGGYGGGQVGGDYGGGQVGGHQGHGHWNCGPHQSGQARGNRYMSWGQSMRGMCKGHQMSKYNRSDAAHRRGNHKAQNHLQNTIRNAWKDGILTRGERNSIKNARRHTGMSGQQVKTDNYRRAYGNAMKNAFSDGVLTSRERTQLGSMRNNLNGMQRQLGNMQSQDRGMDRRESIQNHFFGNQVVGFDPGKFLSNIFGG